MQVARTTEKVEMLGLPDPLRRVLVCPECAGPLTIDSAGVRCGQCSITYPASDQGQVDLRLRRSRQVQISYTIGGSGPGDWRETIRPITANPNPQLDYRAIRIPPLLKRGNRLTPELLSYFPRARESGLMLDLGCGYEDFRELCAHTNMEYVGIDYSGPARILADGHALPFRDQSFDFVMSFAVLEHLRHPMIALREAYRVLKPGARFIGSVAFIEPFHLDSYYHFSPLAVLDALAAAGFEVENVEANSRWTGLRALGWMSLFPHAPQWLSNLLVLPVHMLHRVWWKVGHLVQNRTATSEAARQIVNAGGFRWVCAKP